MEKFKKILPVIVGLLLMGAGVFFYFRAGELARNCTEKTTATVVNMREDIESAEDGIRYIYYPIIEYETAGGMVSGELAASNPPMYSINDKVSILYNPEKTSEFFVEGENQYLVPILLGIIGLVFLGVGGTYAISKKAA
ncbi:DUF3592 domain-containing protein [Candidatus Saccharibacteria bacterium]|nr:DUF3592 domain-containing protein [Candidatus Saccharibacteria bacterium]